MEMVFEAGRKKLSAPRGEEKRQQKVRIAPAPQRRILILPLAINLCFLQVMAGTTGLEPATSAVTGSLGSVTNRKPKDTDGSL